MNVQELYTECHKRFSYDPETGLLTRLTPCLNRHGSPHYHPKTKVGAIVGTNHSANHSNGYLRLKLGEKRYLVHRIIWLMQTGSFPKAYIDHINEVKSDNRWVNLREADSSENAYNRGKSLNNKAGLKGVCYIKGNRKKPYMAQIKTKNKHICLGYFQSPQLAHEAYRKASIELHGEFSVFSRQINPVE